MFSYTTGGPFGLEDMVTTSGPGMTLIYLLVLPFFWCIPVSLVSAELTTAMPVEGGFYRWTRAAFGDFWGFLAGWWNWSASFLLGSVYAVLFADYLSNYFPQITGWKHYLVSLALIAVITWINVRGIQMVGQVATALEIFIFLPVVTMVAIGLAKWQHNPFVPLVVPHQPRFKIFGVGLALGLWLYSGYEQLSTVAEEVEDPQRSYPRALALVVPLSIAAYFLPTLTGLAALGDWQNWHTGHFSEVATLIGGSWLGTWLTLAATVANIALLNSTVLTTTRMPFAMAEDGVFPSAVSRVDPRTGAPTGAIVLAGCLGAVFVLVRKFTELADQFIIGIWPFYALAVAAVFVVRRRRGVADLQYRTWGYPVVPALFLVGALLLLGNYLVSEPKLFWLDIGVIVSGIPVFVAWRARQRALGRRPA